MGSVGQGFGVAAAGQSTDILHRLWHAAGKEIEDTVEQGGAAADVAQFGDDAGIENDRIAGQGNLRDIGHRAAGEQRLETGDNLFQREGLG